MVAPAGTSYISTQGQLHLLLVPVQRPLSPDALPNPCRKWPPCNSQSHLTLPPNTICHYFMSCSSFALILSPDYKLQEKQRACYCPSQVQYLAHSGPTGNSGWVDKSMFLQVKLLESQLFLFSLPVVSNSLQPHGLQHDSLPCPSPFPQICSNSCPQSQWCHPNISFSVAPSPPALSLSQQQGLFQWVGSSH